MTKLEAQEYPEEFNRRWSSIDKNFIHRDVSSLTIPQLKQYIKQDRPDIIFIDQAPRIKTKAQDRRDLMLKLIFVELREVCKEFGVSIFGVTQADAAASKKNEKGYEVQWLDKHHVADCKVGLQGELDIQIGLKRPNDGSIINVSVCKGKETGNSSGKHIMELKKSISRLVEVE